MIKYVKKCKTFREVILATFRVCGRAWQLEVSAGTQTGETWPPMLSKISKQTFQVVKAVELVQLPRFSKLFTL